MENKKTKQANSENMLEQELKEERAYFQTMQSKMLDIDTPLAEVLKLTEKLLASIPKLRKLNKLVQLERAVKKYSNILIKEGLSAQLFEYVVENQRKQIEQNNYTIDLLYSINLEKKLGIHNKGPIEQSNIFDKFRELLPVVNNLDKKEVIIRKVRHKLYSHLHNKNELKSEDMIKFFLYEAGFEDRTAVENLLLNSNLRQAIGAQVVTEEKLSQEIKKVKGDFTALNENIQRILKLDESLRKKVDGLGKIIDKDVPVLFRLISNYLVNPISAAAGVMGIAIIFTYSISWYVFPEELSYLPKFNESLKPHLVYLAAFALMLFSGMFKMLDDKMRRIILQKTWLPKK